MPSPFSGMNPFLEQRSVWHDFHEAFLPAVRQELTQQVRPDFFIRIGEHVYIHELSAEERQFVGRGDVTIHQPGQPQRTSDLATLAAPSHVRLPAVDIEQVSFLEVCDCDDQRVITVIELLSPSNKRPGPDREQYLAKRSELLRRYVNFVELDLLRGGPRMPMDQLAECDYYALVSRWPERPDAGVWPIRLRDPLPAIPIPLDASHPDATLDLQKVLHRVYDDAGYEDYIYRGQPEPKLSPADQEWARTLTTQTKQALENV